LVRVASAGSDSLVLESIKMVKQSLKYAGETDFVGDIYGLLIGTSRPFDYCVVIDMETGIAYTGNYDYITGYCFIRDVDEFLK
jgi:hypothetical protein